MNLEWLKEREETAEYLSSRYLASQVTKRILTTQNDHVEREGLPMNPRNNFDGQFVGLSASRWDQLGAPCARRVVQIPRHFLKTNNPRNLTLFKHLLSSFQCLKWYLTGRTSSFESNLLGLRCWCSHEDAALFSTKLMVSDGG